MCLCICGIMAQELVPSASAQRALSSWLPAPSNALRNAMDTTAALQPQPLTGLQASEGSSVQASEAPFPKGAAEVVYDTFGK